MCGLKIIKIFTTFLRPDFSALRTAQEQGISGRRCSTLLRRLNNAVYELFCAAFGEEHQTGFFNIFKNSLYL